MKIIKRILKESRISIFLMVLATTGLYAQNPTYLCELRNDVQVNASTYEFDVYLLRTGSTVFEFTSMQFGININPLVLNGGNLAVTLVSGTSELNPSQIPTALKFSFSAPNNCIIMTGMAPPGAGSGTIISNTGNGTRVGRIRLTNTVNFASDTPDLTWSFSLLNGYITKVNAYVAGIATDITVQASHTTSNLTNPTFNPPPTAPIVGTITQPTCASSTGSVVLSGLPLVGTWTLTRTPGGITTTGTGATTTISGLSTGTYTYTVTNSAGSTSPSSNNVVINSQPVTPSAPSVGTIIQPTCATSTGSVDLTILPASGTWTLTRTPGGTTTTGTGTSTTISGLAAGTYTYTVTNSDGCASVASGNVAINAQPVTPSAPAIGTITQPTCATSTGSVVLNSLPSSGTWTLTRTPGGTTTTGTGTSTTITGLPSGTYTYTVTNASGCTSLASANVVIDPAPGSPSAPSIGPITQPTCAVSTGSVDLSGLPASGTWTLTRTPGGTTTTGTGTSATITGLPSGTYTYTVTNSIGCTSPASGNVVINSQPATPSAPSVGTITQPTCATSTGSVVLNSLPASGTWTLTRTPGGTTTLGTGTSITITGLASGTYTYTLTNAVGCTSVASGSIVISAQPATPSAPTIGTITQPTCAVATGSVLLTGLPAGNWTINPGAIAGSTATYTISGLATGTYAYTVTTAAGCISLSSANVVINAQPPTPIVNNQTTTISSGQTFTVTPSGGTIPVGTTYTWPAPTYTGLVTGGVAQGSPQLSISGTLTNPSGIGTATYTVTPVFGACTGNVFLVTVTVNSTCVSVSITTQPGNSTVCAITGIASFAVVASGTGPFTYQWQYNSGTWGNVTNGIPAGAVYTNATTATMNVTGISVPAAYQYRCLVTNCSGGNSVLSNAATLTINAPPVPTLTSSDADNIFCFGTSVTFTAGGGGPGANYDFKVNGVTVQTGPTNTYTTTSIGNAQIVTVTVTNASLCSATSAGIANFVNQPPFITSGPTATCAANFLTYSVVLTVSAGTVTSTSGIVANTGGNNWSITGILAGVNITITITDSNGCITPQPVTAPNCLCPVLLPPVSGGDKSYCTGGVIPTLSATVAAGGNPKTIDWYNSSSGGILLLSGSLTYTPTVAGSYYALTREIVSNCVSSTRTPIVLTMNPLPIPTLTSSDADNVFCSGTSIVFTATGGTSYNFFVSGTSVQNGAGATYTTSSLTNGQAVSVVVTNANGCIATSAAITNTVNPTPVPTLTSSDADNIFCAGTSVTFTAGGGTSYDFRIGGVSAQSGSLATFTTGTLTNGQVVNVIVSSPNGCSAISASITNTVNPAPTPTLTSSDADNIFCTGTSVTFTATGGTTYNFRVGGVSVQNSASPTYTTSSLTSGQVVDVIVGNSIGCTVTSSGIINTVYAQPSGNAGTGGNVCDLSFKLNALPSIGIGTWTKTSGPGTATFTPNANTPNAAVTVSEYGTYTFTWTEISGTCSGSSTITVNFYLQPVANPGVGGNNCGLGFRFNASLNAGVGTWSKVSGPGTVSFSPDANSATALVTVSAYGTYVFKWTVNNGTCSNSANVTVVFIQQAAASAGLGGNECDKDFNLNALVPATGIGTWTKSSGPGNAVFTPDNHQPNAKVTVDQFGAYEFTWTVVNSTCTSSDVVKVVFHDLPAINAGADVAICKGNSIQLLAQGTGTVSWVPAALLSNPNILNPIATPDATTTFTVNLTDQFGCKNSDNIVVEVREKPMANAGPDQILGYLLETQMNAVLAHNYEKGLWTVISGTGEFTDTTDAVSVVKSLSSGDNKFLWLVTNGVCPNSQDTIMIKVNDFIIPTLITPNMDGRNDYFFLRGLATLGKTELVIFDRRGAQVYRNLNYDNSWNGVDYNKNPLPDDTYFFVLRTANGKSISGYIVIRR